MSTSEIQNRKQAHIDICRKPKSQGEGNLFSGYRLPYTALPELDLADISTGVTLLGKKLSQPLIIGSMTGGVAHAKTINTHLALAAEELQVALGVGSQRIALEREEAQETFKLVRQFAPTTVLFANMGAVQLNYGREVGDYRRIVDMVKADGLYLHINPLQEALQPGGDTNFRGLLDKVAQVVKHVGVPVFVKEVGHGLDVRTAQALIDRGVVGIDAAGVGGTSWAWVEANRALNNLYESWFKSHGHRTDELIVDYQQLVGDPIKVVSGGVRTPLEIVKAGVLGANFYSLAYPLLDPALISAGAVVDSIKEMERGLKITLFTCACPSWQEVTNLKMVKESLHEPIEL